MNYAAAIIIMAVITYLIRMIPLAFFKKQIQNKRFKAFLFYIPYAVLSAMTFPAILYSTGNIVSAVAAMAAAVVLSYLDKGLMPTAAAAVAVACLVNVAIK